MWLSDVSVRRPVLATVLNLLIIAIGLVALLKLPVREYPDIDPPVISITTFYPGASAAVVETRITDIIEKQISGIEGIRTTSSSSRDGRSRVSIRFDISRNIDDAANDVRDRISRVLSDLPEEADPPEVQKADADENPILWMNLRSSSMSNMELVDYTKRYLEDRFSALDGVARVVIAGGQEKSMRIWLDSFALASTGLTVADVEAALLRENIELPAGFLESQSVDMTVQFRRSYHTAEDFRKLVLKRGENGHLVRLGDVADVEISAVERRSISRQNGLPSISVGIVKQSTANTLEVTRAIREEIEKIIPSLPGHMELLNSYDSSIYIEAALHEVYVTLAIAIVLVVLIMYAFLGNIRSTLVPALTVPVSLIGAFILMYFLGFSINLITFLGMVLAIGLVVDDAIVVIENIHRRIEMGEPPLVAAYHGVRQVSFAIIATTIVLISVFIPITFLDGDIGRLFTEFAVIMAGAVIFSAFAALSFSPMLASKIMPDHNHSGRLTQYVDAVSERIKRAYLKALTANLDKSGKVIGCLVLLTALCVGLLVHIPSELAPQEDRGGLYLRMRGPEGASYEYMLEHALIAEQRLMPRVENGELQRVLSWVPGSFEQTSVFNNAFFVVQFADWGVPQRKYLTEYMDEIRAQMHDIPGVTIAAIPRPGLGGGTDKPVRFVLKGTNYESLREWRDIILKKAAENPNLLDLDHNHYEIRPQIGVQVNHDRAAMLGVPLLTINRALESMLGSRKVTTFIDDGEEYDVIVESRKEVKRSPSDIDNIYVRSTTSGSLIPLSNLVTFEEFADATDLKHFNRLRAITIEANLAEGYTLGQALDYLDELAREALPSGALVDYAGQSEDYKKASGSLMIVFGFALVIVFLVLAGQFESFIHPLIIMLTVPLAMTGALAALWLAGFTLNIYSQIGLIILVGLATKNGILIVEFINQHRDRGFDFQTAILEASGKRLRPIVMTGLTTAIGALPLIITSGAGAESRMVIGTVIFAGIITATGLTLFVVPTMYYLLARKSASPEATARKLESFLAGNDQQA